MRASLNPWNPWQELDQIQHEMGRLFGRRMGNALPRSAFPAVNVWGDESSLVLTAEIPGVDPEKLDITVNRNTIVLRGTREVGKPRDGETYYRQERQGAEFSRTCELPFDIDPESADATYEKGVLTLRLARPNEHLPKKVVVKAP